MSFADLKAKANDMSSLVGAAQSTTEKKSYGDDRMWKPTVDKAGNGYAVIRFLPAVEGDDLPWAKYWDHFFQGPTGQWYVEKSLTTIQKDDPVSEMNSKLWNTGIEADKDMLVDVSVAYTMCQTSMLFLTLRVQKTMAKYSYILMVLKSLRKSWIACNLSMKMKHLSIHLTYGKVLTSK